MKINRVSNRVYLFTFDELYHTEYKCLTNVMVIVTKESYIFCDTYLGQTYMKQILNYLDSKYENKKKIAFNSHSHWDHIWGNEFFNKDFIIAHKKCKHKIIKYGEKELNENFNKFTLEPVQICLPNITFSTEFNLNSEGVKFMYTPGHTDDMSSCFDLEDKVLYVSDNVEEPFPNYMCWENLDAYINTLQQYLSLDVNVIVSGHSESIISREVLKNNIKYLECVKQGKKPILHNDVSKQFHETNLPILKKIINNRKGISK